jgi:phosphatidylserine/phosphatidylglycerophosphate/cardiolipin synthase-like enzyme
MSIAKAIADAHRRGVKVRVVMDKTQAAGKYSSATYLFNAGVPVWIDHVSGLMHNKFLVLDGKTIITGSFNLTKGADEENAENMLVIEGKEKLVKAYSDDFEKVKSKSTPYEGVHPEK